MLRKTMKSESNDNRRWIIEGVFDNDDETKEKKYSIIFLMKFSVWK